jgi:hypothetical protein
VENLRNLRLPSHITIPVALKKMDDGSGTVGGATALNVPDCELVMLRPEEKSVGVHVPLGQKKSWIFSGVGGMPFGRGCVRNSEKPPV